MDIVYDDIIYSLQKSGGGSVYWTEITKRLGTNAMHYVYDDATNNFFYKERELINEIKLSSKFLIVKRYLNMKLMKKNPFIFHSSLYRFCKNKTAINITTVHDFTYEYFRKDLKSILHKIQKKRAVMHSSGVICISENTKKDLLKFYPKYKGIIKVIYNGFSDDVFFKEELTEKRNIILFVGARTDYKRFDLCVEIVERLSEYKLVIVGGGDLTSEEETLLNMKLENRYEKKGYLNNDELRKLYNEAFFLCYPSEYEGFGIPIIEAQACGCPVVCQNVSSIPEVSKDTVIYIDSKGNFDENIVKISRLFNTDYYAKLVEDGLENTKRFSWDKCAHEVEEFYKEFLEK